MEIRLTSFITLLVTITLFAQTSYAASSCSHPFIDLSEHWAEEEICELYAQGIVEGYSERNYLPKQEVTRAEFLKISLLNLGYKVYAVQSASFSDVENGAWYYTYVTFAKSKGFVSGYSDGTFRPDALITRAEAVVMIMQMAGIVDYSSFGFEPRFSDLTSATDWFAPAVNLATDYGIIEGYGDGSFRPYANLSRAEAAVIAVRVWENLY